MFNIGTPEILVILIIALLVVGPNRLPELGRSIGKGLRELRKVQDEVRDMVQTGIGDDLNAMKSELHQTAGEIKKATDVRSAFPSQPHKPDAPDGEPTSPDTDS